MVPRRVKIYGRNSGEIADMVTRLGLEIDEDRPDVVVSYGGDGTLLGAEREWPGVPKVALRDSRRCRTCSHESNEMILRHLAEGCLKRSQFIKLQAQSHGETLTCLNDVMINKAQVNSGVRCRVWIDDEAYGDDEIVGDGLVVATPFGSAAYYCSITHSTLRVGIGLAFNNTIEPINHLVLAEESVVRVVVTRGPALMLGDNDPHQVPLTEGDEVIVRRADHDAVVLAYDRMRYPADQFIFYNG